MDTPRQFLRRFAPSQLVRMFCEDVHLAEQVEPAARILSLRSYRMALAPDRPLSRSLLLGYLVRLGTMMLRSNFDVVDRAAVQRELSATLHHDPMMMADGVPEETIAHVERIVRELIVKHSLNLAFVEDDAAESTKKGKGQ